MWSWNTRPDGIVEVDRGSGYEGITLPGPDASTARTEGWIEPAKKYSDQFGVPLSWILGIIYSESGGKPDVRNSCCAGLMALALKVYKISEAQAFDPETNMQLGVQTLGHYRGKGFDLPSTASMYNAGPSAITGKPKISFSDPWGMVEDHPAVPWTGYIEKVVRASNWWRTKELSGELGMPPPPNPEPRTVPEPVPLAGASPVAPMALGAAGGWLLVSAWKKVFGPRGRRTT